MRGHQGVKGPDGQACLSKSARISPHATGAATERLAMSRGSRNAWRAASLLSFCWLFETPY